MRTAPASPAAAALDAETLASWVVRRELLDQRAGAARAPAAAAVRRHAGHRHPGAGPGRRGPTVGALSDASGLPAAAARMAAAARRHRDAGVAGRRRLPAAGRPAAGRPRRTGCRSCWHRGPASTRSPAGPRNAAAACAATWCRWSASRRCGRPCTGCRCPRATPPCWASWAVPIAPGGRPLRTSGGRAPGRGPARGWRPARRPIGRAHRPRRLSAADEELVMDVEEPPALEPPTPPPERIATPKPERAALAPKPDRAAPAPKPEPQPRRRSPRRWNRCWPR